jgi:hypothetical protein
VKLVVQDLCAPGETNGQSAAGHQAPTERNRSPSKATPRADKAMPRVDKDTKPIAQDTANEDAEESEDDNYV